MGCGCPAEASKPHETRTMSGLNSLATGITTLLLRESHFAMSPMTTRMTTLARALGDRSKIRAPFLPERGQVLGVSHGRLEPARPRNVDVETDAGTDPALDRTSGSRVKVAVVVAV